MHELGVIYVRILATMVLVPFGSDVSSAAYRCFLSALLVIVLPPTFLDRASDIVGLEAVVENIALGLALGIPIMLVAHAAEWFGELFDSLRGQTIGSVLDPSQPISSAVALASGAGARALIFGTGFLCVLCSQLKESFVEFPVADPFSGPLSSYAAGFLLFLARFCAAGLAACLPFAIIFAGIEISFGIISKAVPGLSLATESFGLKLAAGFLVLAAVSDVELFDSLISAVPMLSAAAVGG